MGVEATSENKEHIKDILPVLLSSYSDYDENDYKLEYEYEQASYKVMYGSLTEEEKLMLLNAFSSEIERAEVIKTFLSDAHKVQSLSCLNIEMNKRDVILSLSNDAEKIKAISFLDSDYSKEKAISSLSNDDEKVNALSFLDDDYYKVEVITSLSDDEEKLKALSCLESDYYKSKVITILTDDNKKINALSFLDEEIYKKDVILSLQNDEEKLKVLSYLKSDSYKNDVISIVLPDDDKKMKALSFLDDKSLKRLIILGLSDDTKKIDFLIEYCSTRELEQEEKIRKKEILAKLYEGNYDVLQSINVDFLDDKYIDIFGQAKFEQLACYSDAQEKICLIGKDDTLGKLDIFERCSEFFLSENGDRQWNILTAKLLDSLAGDTFDELLQSIKDRKLDIDSFSDENLRNLTTVLTSNNIFNIRTIDDLQNFNSIRQSVCDALMVGDEKKLKNYPEIINLDITDRKKLAILELSFGINLEEAKNLIALYGADIDKIKSSDLQSRACIDYINCLKLIIDQENPDVLDQFMEKFKQLFEQLDKSGNIFVPNPIAMEGDLKTAYFKEYTKGLFQIHDGRKLEGDNMYDAGTDFNMLISSVHAYVGSRTAPENFEKEWNVNLKSSQGICTSYISNEMMATARVPFCCYGFSTIEDDSLFLEGSSDIVSNSNKLVPDAGGDNCFHTPQEEINLTPDSHSHHNELVIARQKKDGSKVQPDYIVAFKKGGKILSEDYVKKAQADFGGIPIVVIDVNKCILSERIKVLDLIKVYKKTGDEETRKAIIQKIRNNEETAGSNAIKGRVGNSFESYIVGLISDKKDIQSLLDDIDNIDIERVDAVLQQLADKLKKMESTTPNMITSDSFENGDAIRKDETDENDKVCLSQYNDAYEQASKEKMARSVHLMRQTLQTQTELSDSDNVLLN